MTVALTGHIHRPCSPPSVFALQTPLVPPTRILSSLRHTGQLFFQIFKVLVAVAVYADQCSALGITCFSQCPFPIQSSLAPSVPMYYNIASKSVSSTRVSLRVVSWYGSYMKLMAVLLQIVSSGSGARYVHLLYLQADTPQVAESPHDRRHVGGGTVEWQWQEDVWS